MEWNVEDRGSCLPNWLAAVIRFQLRLVNGLAADAGGQKVELIALPEGPAEPRRPHFEHWEPLSHRLAMVANSTSFHL